MFRSRQWFASDVQLQSDTTRSPSPYPYPYSGLKIVIDLFVIFFDSYFLDFAPSLQFYSSVVAHFVPFPVLVFLVTAYSLVLALLLILFFLTIRPAFFQESVFVLGSSAQFPFISGRAAHLSFEFQLLWN